MKFNILTDKEIAAKAKELILADFTIYDTVDELTSKIKCSAYKLRNAFKKQNGVSLFTFSRATRLEEAKRLLTETNYPLQTIAGMVGFEERNNFQASFKTVVGVTRVNGGNGIYNLSRSGCFGKLRKIQHCKTRVVRRLRKSTEILTKKDCFKKY